MTNEEPIIVQRPSFLSGKTSQDDILKLLDNLEDLADGTYSVFGRLWGLDREEFYMLTNKIRASLPDEVRRASRVANDSDKIVSTAREEAKIIGEQAIEDSNRIVDEARQMASKLVDTSEIGRLAKSQAQDIISNAEAEAREVRRGADEYAREILMSMENHVANVMGTLQKGREKLDIRIQTQNLVDPVIPVGRGRR